ncbi:MAG: hypothetical protein RM368_32790, partial [Nostoc sp. DedSLP03]|uniref:hypothetical protein n=1 Tax=Nostoc sp. DedSLP03 TaxID=3075400 RepID=UPI002AD1D7FA
MSKYSDQPNYVRYDEQIHSTSRAFELYSQGIRFYCPICNSEILVLEDYKSSSKYHKHPGIYCSLNEQHVNIRDFQRINYSKKNKKYVFS